MMAVHDSGVAVARNSPSALPRMFCGGWSVEVEASAPTTPSRVCLQDCRAAEHEQRHGFISDSGCTFL